MSETQIGKQDTGFRAIFTGKTDQTFENNSIFKMILYFWSSLNLPKAPIFSNYFKNWIDISLSSLCRKETFWENQKTLDFFSKKIVAWINKIRKNTKVSGNLKAACRKTGAFCVRSTYSK